MVGVKQLDILQNLLPDFMDGGSSIMTEILHPSPESLKTISVLTDRDLAK